MDPSVPEHNLRTMFAFNAFVFMPAPSVACVSIAAYP